MSDISGAEKITIKHKIGTTITIDAAGNITLYSGNTVTIQSNTAIITTNELTVNSDDIIFNATDTTEICTLSYTLFLHFALPIWGILE